MRSRYESKEELASKVDWEGGVTEAINGYGIGADELPEGTPLEIVTAWRMVEAVDDPVSTIRRWLYDE
jgi:hypothetical protein